MRLTVWRSIIRLSALALGIVPVLYSLFFRVKFRDFRYNQMALQTTLV